MSKVRLSLRTRMNMVIVFFRRIIHLLESAQIGFTNYILSFVGAITLRNFLEIFSDRSLPSITRYAHYYCSYICASLSLIILFYFATKEKVGKIARVVLPFFLIVILAPLLDLALSGGKGYNMSYLLPGFHQNLFLRFITFFGHFDKLGVTPGMKIEISLALSFSFIYFFVKTGKWLKSLLFSIFMYSLIFFYCIIPFFAKTIMQFFRLEYVYSDMLMRNIYFLLLFILGAWMFYLYNRAYFTAIVKDMRILRILHFELMFVLGYVFARRQVYLTAGLLWTWFFISAAIFFAGLFSLATNNLADCDIDKVSNKTRPLVSQRISRQDYTRLSWIFLAAAIFYSSAANFMALFITLLLIGNYFLYSMPPLRLKRIPFFSKLFISLNSLALFILGYYLSTGNLWVPDRAIVFFLLYFTPAINFIDIKDYEGDKLNGIRTFPVILGLRLSKFIIGIFFLLSYFAIGAIAPGSRLLVFSAIFGLLMFLLINRKNYSEKPVLIAYLLSLFIFIIYLLKY